MENVEDLRIESDERGFELWLWLDDEPVFDESEGRIALNIHSVAMQLYDEVVKVIGPWRAEALAAKAEYDRAGGHPMCPDEDGRCQHGRDDECPRIDPDRVPWEAMADVADRQRKIEKGE